MPTRSPLLRDSFKVFLVEVLVVAILFSCFNINLLTNQSDYEAPFFEVVKVLGTETPQSAFCAGLTCF